jgi:photosystem II stability/assembly factor-like uncharacterized protein
MERSLTLFAATDQDIARIELRDGATARAEPSLTGVGAMCVAADPRDPNRLLAGTFERGAFLTDDGGKSWRPVGEGIPHPRILSVAISPCNQVNGKSVLYAGSEPSNLYRSEDDGATWRDFPALPALPSAPTWSFPPRPWTSHVRWIALHPTDPQTIYVGIELGGVMTTRDGGATWEDRKPGAQPDAHALATHPARPDRVYEAAGGGVAVSDDDGRIWHGRDAGMDRHYAWGLAIDADDPDLWYVSASTGPRAAHNPAGDAQAVIYRARGDAPWQALGGDGAGVPSILRSFPYALVAPRSRPGAIVAGLANGSLLVSDDAGESWRTIETGLPHIGALAEAYGG